MKSLHENVEMCKQQGVLNNKGRYNKFRNTVMLLSLATCLVGFDRAIALAPTASEPVHEVGGPISLAVAEQMTANFRDKFGDYSYAHLFGKNIINQILNEPGVEGINYYNAQTIANDLEMLMVGVAASGEDLLNGTIGAMAQCCPSKCGPRNTLNGDAGGCTGPIYAVGNSVALSDAKVKTARFRDAFENYTYGHLFGKDILNQLLGEPGVEGIRFYSGLNNDGVLHLIMVGVDANGADLMAGTIADITRLCPPLCGDKNGLNSDDY